MKYSLLLLALAALASCQKEEQLAHDAVVIGTINGEHVDTLLPEKVCSSFGVRVVLYAEPQNYSVEYFNCYDNDGPKWEKLVKYLEFSENWNPIMGNYDEAYRIAKKLKSMEDVEAYLANERKKVPNYPVRPKETRVY